MYRPCAAAPHNRADVSLVNYQLIAPALLNISPGSRGIDNQKNAKRGFGLPDTSGS